MVKTMLKNTLRVTVGAGLVAATFVAGSTPASAAVRAYRAFLPDSKLDSSQISWEGSTVRSTCSLKYNNGSAWSMGNDGKDLTVSDNTETFASKNRYNYVTTNWTVVHSTTQEGNINVTGNVNCTLKHNSNKTVQIPVDWVATNMVLYE